MKKTMHIVLITAFIIAALLIGSGCKDESEKSDIVGGANMKLTSLFVNGDQIPNEYTCDGDSVSPPLLIEGVPANAKSLALIFDDPDAPAGVFTHWIVWNIKPDITNIPKGNAPGEEGINDFKEKGYGAPCPPSGIHHYYFRLYALDNTLNLPSATRRKEIDNAIKGHIIAQAHLSGFYSRTD